LVATLRKIDAEKVYGWLPTANTFCVAAKPFLRHAEVVVSVHLARRLDTAEMTWAERLSHEVHLRMVKWADRATVNSIMGKDELLNLGVRQEKLFLAPNGMDTENLRYDPEGRNRVRAELSVTEDEMLFGLVSARIEPRKGYDVFLHAGALIKDRLPAARFVCFGRGRPDSSAALASLAARLGLQDVVMWPGIRNDLAAVYSAVDVLVCSSHSEGGPNVVGEAMACGTPCVSTDVGYAAEMVGNTGLIVPVGDPHLLGEAMLDMAERIRSDRDELRKAARQRITTNFGLDHYASAVMEALRLT
jgi:glycosyltransferase involved in cell wall biosynthesis